MASEDITFCANRYCQVKSCPRNMKNIRIFSIPHSYAMFRECEKWKENGAKWIDELLKEGDSDGN